MPMKIDLQDIRRPIEAELQQYSLLFDQVLTHKEKFMDQALAYVRSSKGKMMRPILVLLLARERGEINEAALRSAITLELLHTSSLVHDDVVDESDERRGKPSVHKMYDNKVAVLLGDFMLANTLHQAALTRNLAIVEHVSLLGATLSEGEIFQLANVDSKTISEEAYYSIIKNKTAALFIACGALAALATDADEEFYDRAKKLGEIVGLCFQIRDDIFDYYDDPSIGKPRGNDMKEGKLTLPAIYAVNSSKNPDILALAMKVKAHEATPDEIEQLMAFTKANGGIDYAQKQMQRLREEAVQLLSDFKNDEIRQALTLYVDFVIGRGY